jgi:nucleotide-binding universal stress UspA family protein
MRPADHPQDHLRLWEKTMKLETILFPTDFSQHSRAALTLATSLARDAGARMLIAHVKEPPVELVAGGGLGVAELGLDMETVKAELSRIRPTDPSVPFEHHLLRGSAVPEIVRLAKKEDVDLIVMSTHGRTGLMHLLMGSIAEAVVRRAPCPVITMKVKPESPKIQATPELLQEQDV